MAFPKNEINNFVLGSEDGNVYSGELHFIRNKFKTFLFKIGNTVIDYHQQDAVMERGLV